MGIYWNALEWGVAPLGIIMALFGKYFLGHKSDFSSWKLIKHKLQNCILSGPMSPQLKVISILSPQKKKDPKNSLWGPHWFKCSLLPCYIGIYFAKPCDLCYLLKWKWWWAEDVACFAIFCSNSLKISGFFPRRLLNFVEILQSYST